MKTRSNICRSVLVVLIILFSSAAAQSACKNIDDGLWETADNTHFAVIECIESASAGDDIHVVAGSGSVTWPENAVTIPANKPLNIIGPGKDNLTINLSEDFAFRIDPFVETPTLGAAQISGFRFVSPHEMKYGAIQARGKGWRIHDCEYNSIVSPTTITTGVFVIGTGINTTVEPSGLVDNNTIINGKIQAVGFLTFEKMSGVWADPLNLGTKEAVYIENNVFTTTVDPSARKQLAVDSNYSGKYVFRYNTLTQYDALVHGLQTDESRGGRKWEIYGNQFKSEGYGTYDIMNIKSGTGVAFYNLETSNPSEAYNQFVNLQHERSDKLIGLSGSCDGTSEWDANEPGENGWLCRDQVGAGTDIFAWQNPPINNPAPPQDRTPAYFWLNQNANGEYPKAYLAFNAATHIKSDRDYFEHVASFDGSSGVGVGKLSDRPMNCATGVAYWSTDQDLSTLTDMTGAYPLIPIEGKLYKCTSTDTWTEHYTPYQFPHELAEGLNSGINPPQNLRIVSDENN